MSTKENATTNDKSQGLTLVERVLALKNLSESDKISKFIDREVKRANSEIKSWKRSIEQLEYNYDEDVEKLDEKREDAELALISVKANIDPELLADNSSMDTFASTYWNRIKSAQAKLDSVDDELKKLKDTFKEELETQEKEKGKYEARLKTLTEKI